MALYDQWSPTVKVSDGVVQRGGGQSHVVVGLHAQRIVHQQQQRLLAFEELYIIQIHGYYKY